MGQISLKMDFGAEMFPTIWGWLTEFPNSNLDDYGATDLETFTDLIESKRASGVWYFLVEDDALPVGIIGFAPVNPEMGYLQGVCFTKSAHGTRAPQVAFYTVLESLKTAGIRKVCAQYFNFNTHIRVFLRGFGAVLEGKLKDQTRVGGELVDVEQVALFIKES